MYWVSLENRWTSSLRQRRQSVLHKLLQDGSRSQEKVRTQTIKGGIMPQALHTEICDHCNKGIVTAGPGAEEFVSRRQGWHNRKYYHNSRKEGKDCWFQVGRDKPGEPRQVPSDLYSTNWQTQHG